MMRVCFERLASARRILVLCISKLQSRKLNNCWLWKYKFGEKSTRGENIKPRFLHDGFSTNLTHKIRVLLKICSIFSPSNVYHGISFGYKDYSVFFGRHTIFQHFLVKCNLYSLRRFNLRRSVKDDMPNIKIITKKFKASAHGHVCLLFKLEYITCRKCFS